MAKRLAIDTGGTFTDIISIDEVTGEMIAVKTSSTPKNPSVGLIKSIDRIIESGDKSRPKLDMVLHGSTVATNAVLEHKFDGLGLLVTKGFRHMIEIARQSVPDGYGNSFFWVKPPRLVPLHMVREVQGRLLSDGSQVEPIDEKQTIEAVLELVEDGASCIAVCLLHSYANATHEQRIKSIISDNFPDLFISISSQVLPEYREYERAMTTLVDVMVKPYCQTYLQNAADSIATLSKEAPFLIMQSSGGVVKHSTAAERPVTMLLSGPAAGILGAVHMAKLAGFDNILTSDVGGTSTDVSIVENQTPMYTSSSMVESYPVKTPMLDIVTVGSGGGSIAWTDDYGNLKVGPKSAGADPGPICYDKGGKQPTVTDAALVLGRLPESLIGGEIKLNVKSARHAFEKLGKEHKMTPEDIALGVLELAAISQVFGIRQVTTTRGRDPSKYTMVAFGGAGGLFATEVADFLNIKTILSPPNPGNLCALGLHVSDVKRDYIRTMVSLQTSADNTAILTSWLELADQGVKDIEAEGISKERIKMIYVADMRYLGEGHEVQVTVPKNHDRSDMVQFVWKEFHDVHEKTFGFNYEGEQDVELVNLRVQAIGEQFRPNIGLSKGPSAPAEKVATRLAYWDSWVESPIYKRADIQSNQEILGPAIIEEYGSTIVVPANWFARRDSYGNLIIRKENKVERK